MANDNLWMPLYVGDYLADTMRLTTAQHGAYLLLLMDYWRNGPLPDDPKQLLMIARSDARTWARDIWPVVGAFFRRGDDGRLHQKRADAELTKAGERGEHWRQRREAGTERMRRWRERHNGTDQPPPNGEDVTRHEQRHPPDSDASLKRHETRTKRDNTPHHNTEEKKGGSLSLTPSARATPPEIGENLPVLRKTKALRTLLPADWQPSAASLDHAIRLGFDADWAQNQANRMRNWAEMSNAVVDDWDRRFDRWMEVESYTIRQAKAAAEPKSVHQQIREAGNLPTFLGPMPDDDSHGIRLTAIAGGKA